MLAPFQFVKNSRVLPFNNIVALLDWKQEIYKSSKQEIIKFSEQGIYLIPVFLINDKYYVPKQFNKTGKPAYPGMKETNLEIFANLSDIKYTTIPILTEVIENYEYGLIQWFDNSTTLDDRKQKINLIDVAQILECGLELTQKDVFHLDLNYSNIIKQNRIYFIDPSIAKNHFRPKHNYFNERAVSYHWSPEILNGGFITEKSSIYSIGKTLDFCKITTDNRVTNLVNAFTEQNPNNRPSFDEAYKKIKELV